MRSKKTYLVRIDENNAPNLDDYVADRNIEIGFLTNDFSTRLYSLRLDDDEALLLRLAFPILGWMSFNF